MLSLAAFPQVLDMMSEKLDWMQRLGDAFLQDEAAVMRTVQVLRVKAQQAGNLQSTDQQKVIVQDRYIIVEPAQPQYVYVPVYDPYVIYGPWWVPFYRPWFWYPPPIWGYPPYRGGVVVVYWGPRWVVSVNHWGWCRPNWNSGTVNININNGNIWVNRPQYREGYGSGGNWNHDVEHRRGVAYRDPATGAKYRPANHQDVQTRESYRGRDTAGPAGGGGAAAQRPAGNPAGGARTPSVSTPAKSAAAPETRPAPAYRPESRPEVQRDAARGAQSRAAMQRPAPSGKRGGSGAAQRKGQ